MNTMTDTTTNKGATEMKAYNKKSNARRAADSLAKRFPDYVAADPVAADAPGEWYPALMAPNWVIAEGVGDEIAGAAFVNGKRVGSPPVIEPAPAPVVAPPVKADKPAKVGRKPRATSGDPLAPPDFSAKTHERYRPKLAALVALVQARDVNGLKQFHVNPTSTSPKALMRYRDSALAALEG
jgi:hypothetical protein